MYKKKRMKMKNKEKIKIERVEKITPHNEALYQSGKDLLVDSINSSKDFCKDMIKISISAIPVYIGLMKFILPENYYSIVSNNIYILFPTLLFLASSIIFIIGYLPKKVIFSLDIIEEIEAARKSILRRRTNYMIIGIILFFLGTVFTIFFCFAKF